MTWAGDFTFEKLEEVGLVKTLLSMTWAGDFMCENTEHISIQYPYLLTKLGFGYSFRFGNFWKLLLVKGLVLLHFMHQDSSGFRFALT